jgi:hypothetical protein
MAAAPEGLKHTPGVFPVRGFTENGAVHRNKGVRREYPQGAPAGEEFYDSVDLPYCQIFRQFPGPEIFAVIFDNVGRHDAEGQPQKPEIFLPPR